MVPRCPLRVCKGGKLSPTLKPQLTQPAQLNWKLTVVGRGVEVAGPGGEGQGEALAHKLCRLDPARGELSRNAVLGLVHIEHLQPTIANTAQWSRRICADLS